MIGSGISKRRYVYEKIACRCVEVVCKCVKRGRLKRRVDCKDNCEMKYVGKDRGKSPR